MATVDITNAIPEVVLYYQGHITELTARDGK